jgi:hypothetical protein
MFRNANTKFLFQRANEILLKRNEINVGKFYEWKSKMIG